MATCLFAACAASVWAQNLLQSPGFEELSDGKPAGWTLSGGAETVADAAVAHSGQRCGKARFDDGVAQQVAIDGGSAYRISGWIRRAGPGGSEVPKIKVYFLDAQGGRADVQATLFDDVASEKWRPWETVFQAPFHAKFLNLTLRGMYHGSEWFYYDDLAVERIDAIGWPAPEATPNLHGLTVRAPDVADVWTDALLRIPPRSLVPVDGKLGSSVLTRGEDIRLQFQRPARVNWALVHSMRPQMNLGEARLFALGEGRGGVRARRLLAESAPKQELVTSLRFEPTVASEVVLAPPDDVEIHVNEIQLLEVGEAGPLPGERVELALVRAAPPKAFAPELALAFAAPEHRASVVACAEPAPGGAAELTLPAEQYLNVFATPRQGEYGLAGLSVDLAVSGAHEDDMIEVTLRRPEELDVDIRWATHTDRGVPARSKRRNYATVFRVASRVEVGRLSVAFDVPDLVYGEGEPVWVTLRPRRDVTLDLARSRMALRLLRPEEALAEYLPQLERLMRRMYSDASEAHAYDSRDWSRMVLGRYVRRVLALAPGNRAAAYIHRRIAKVRENVTLTRPGPPDAPDWAVWAREALRGRDDVIAWWLRNRQQANGELAGHINDDGEFSCNWPSHYLMTGEQRLAAALRKLADVAWEMSAGTGYTVGSRDVEHAAEDQSCTQPQVLVVDYGAPKAVERLMVMSRYLDMWTAINEVGRRQFKSYMFTTRQVWQEPPFDVDQPYCPLAMVGAGHLIWYAHSPAVGEIFRQEAESWALGCLSTDGGKPAGQIPKEIYSRDSRIDPYAPYPSNPILQKRNSLYRNGAGAYIIRYFIHGAYALTGGDVHARVLGLWDPSDESKLERAKGMLRRFNQAVVEPTGPERRCTVSGAGCVAIEAPMKVVRDGEAVGTTAQENGGSAKCVVKVATPGRYAVWALLGRTDPAEEGMRPKTFFVRVDDHAEERVRIHAPAHEWTAVANSTVYDLGAGEHTLTIRGRTPGSALKEIGFTTRHSVEGTWGARQSETTLYEAWRATGDRKWLVEELKEVVRQQVRTRWLLTEAEPYTDRVPLPGRDLLCRMFLGDWTSGKSHVPGHWVSWEGGGLDYAALVVEAAPKRLRALLHSFHPREQPMTMRVWRLPHGRYDVAIGVDRDDDGRSDEQLRREEMELWRHDGAVRFAAQPGRTLVIELSLLAPLEDVRTRPDLAIGPDDITVQEGAVLVTVHNIGGASAPPSGVEARAADGSLLGSARVPALAAPHDLQPRTAQVRVPLAQAGKPAWVMLDPAAEVAEITEANNRARAR